MSAANAQQAPPYESQRLADQSATEGYLDDRRRPPPYESRARPQYSYRPPRDADRSQFSLLGHFGFGGQANISGSRVSGSDSLETSYGVLGRIDFALSPYFALGFSIGGIWWRSGFDEYFGGDYNVILLVDPSLKPRYPFYTKRGYGEVFLRVPVGLSVSFPRGFAPLDTGYGWNIGVLGGFQFLYRGSVGPHLELGWQRQDLYHTDPGNFGFFNDSVNVNFNQFILRVGFTVLI